MTRPERIEAELIAYHDREWMDAHEDLPAHKAGEYPDACGGCAALSAPSAPEATPDLERLKRENRIHEQSWQRLMLVIARVSGEEDPAAACEDGEYDPWRAMEAITVDLASAREEGRRAGIEEAAKIVDACNREGPYQAIAAAERIRAPVAGTPAPDPRADMDRCKACGASEPRHTPEDIACVQQQRDWLWARLHAAEALLRDLEWNAWDAGTGNAVCVECAWEEPTHKVGCRLAALLTSGQEVAHG